MLNQASYKDSQNNEVDIEKMYADFIQEIDSIRGMANLGTNQSLFKNLDEDGLTGLSNKLKVESEPQESRCHAFYRLIGFPCVHQNQVTLYNPGFASSMEDPFVQSIATKLTVLQYQDEKFEKVSSAREQYPLYLSFLFKSGTDINASCFVLSTANSRSFSSSFAKGEINTFSIEDQQYVNDFQSYSQNISSLLEYQDSQGNKPTKLSAMKRNHLIQPFQVDARIDLTTSPNTKLVAVPFLPTKQKLLLSENTYAKRPLIEKIIRDRFSATDISSAGTNAQDVFDFIKALPELTDQTIVQRVGNRDVYSVNEQNQFIHFVNLIRSLLKQLVKEQDIVRKAQNDYYWLPVVKQEGPENACGVQDLPLSVSLSTSGLLSIKDQDILQLTLKMKLNAIVSDMNTTTNIPDDGDFSLSSFPTVFDMKNAPSLGDIAKKNKDNLTSKREKELMRGSVALRKIEIITGECSGLGLLDILMVMGALYLMPKEDLLGFFDKPSQERCKSVMSVSDLELGITEETNYTKAVISFYEAAKTYANLMDGIYEDLLFHNAG